MGLWDSFTSAFAGNANNATNTLGNVANLAGQAGQTLGNNLVSNPGIWSQLGNNAGDILKYGGALWSAFNQQNMGKKNFKLQQDAYNYNKMLSDRELGRQDRANKTLNDAWNASMFGKGL